MSAPLKLYELTGSPNNVKVRLALGYKKLPYERRPLELNEYPGDRSEVIRVSRQPRMPVLVHGDTVIFDSGAILRYLEANFPDTPPLFLTDYKEFGEIEEWEMWARTHIGEVVGTMFGQALSPSMDEAVCKEASRKLNELTAKVESRLTESPFLMADHPTAADLTCVPGIFLGMMPESAAQSGPIHAAFHKHFHLGKGRDRTRDWVMKIMEYDEEMRG